MLKHYLAAWTRASEAAALAEKMTFKESCCSGRYEDVTALPRPCRPENC